MQSLDAASEQWERQDLAKQIRAEAEVGGGGAGGADALSPEMRRFIEEAKASGMTRCPIRDIEEKVARCPVDLKTTTPEEARAAVERVMHEEADPDGAVRGSGRESM